MIRLAVAGALGRTGRRVVELALQDDRFEVVAALTAPECTAAETIIRGGQGSAPVSTTLSAQCDVLIDFTLPAGTMAWLEVCRARGIAFVTGVTGHSEAQRAEIRRSAATIPILQASNFSIGINALLARVGQLARELGPDYDIEIVETHHRHKIDAPSGTARALIEAIAAATGRSPITDVVSGRLGEPGKRPRGQIGVHSVRMGEIVGRHEVHFSGPGETITLTHTAHSRDTFAAGALRAAAWLVGKGPSYYTMGDLMG